MIWAVIGSVMTISNLSLKSLSEDELIDRYNSQAQFTVGSLDLYLEELRHREICGLLEALRGGDGGVQQDRVVP